MNNGTVHSPYLRGKGHARNLSTKVVHIPSLVEGVVESSGDNLGSSSPFFFRKYLTYIQIANSRTMHTTRIHIPAATKLLAK